MIKYYKMNNFSESLNKYSKQIEDKIKNNMEYYNYFLQNQTNSYAQLYLGIIYENSYYVKENYNEAIKWYKLSVEQNNSYAQNNLGFMYINGLGVEKDYNEAIKWFKLSAKQNHSYAQNNLGFMYKNSLGVEKDYNEAIKWYKLSAEQNNSFAQNNLGCLYEEGCGVEKDYRKAIKWYKLSADNNCICGQQNLEKLMEYYKKNIFEEYFEIKKDYKKQKKYIIHLETLPGSKLYEEAMSEFYSLTETEKEKNNTN